MKIDFSQPILHIDGTDTGLTLGTASIQAMITPWPGDQDMPATDKVRLFDISLKVHAGGEIDLPVEDLALLKARIGKVSPQLVVGRAYAMLA